jgi:hypothetical protein
LAADVDSCLDGAGINIRVQTAATASNVGDTSWGPITYDGDIDLPLGSLQGQRDAVVLHWLLWDDEEILSYNLDEESLGMVTLSPIKCLEKQIHLGRSCWRMRIILENIFHILHTTKWNISKRMRKRRKCC